MLAKKSHIGWALVLVLGCSGGGERTAQEHEIVSKPINFDETRKELTLDYIHQHYDSTAQNIIIDPKVIVIHWTAIPTFAQTFATFDPDTLPAARGKDIFFLLKTAVLYTLTYTTYTLTYHLHDGHVLLPPEVLLVLGAHRCDSVVHVHDEMDEGVDHGMHGPKAT